MDRLKLEAAYAKNALFSCRIHHVQDPSFSMAGLFARESSRSRQQGFNVARELKKGLFMIIFTKSPMYDISYRNRSNPDREQVT